MVTVCTVQPRLTFKKSLHFVDTLCVCLTILALNTVYFPNVMDRLVIIKETQAVLCEVETEF